jgi:AcrR family transcriptional regulator
VRDGYAKLTTTRVARRAGVSVGTLYQYFPDKRSLVTALKVRYFGLMAGAVEAALARDDSTDLEAVLRRALVALIGVKREHLDLTKALRGPMAELDGLSFLRDTSEYFASVLAPHLARARPGEEGAAPRAAAILVAALEGAISHAVYTAPGWLEADWFVDDLVQLAVGYLGGGAGRLRRGAPGSPRQHGLG